jgi:hypothetical protein
MLSFMRKLWSRETVMSGFTFDRPLVIIQSDDWGRVGVRDHEGCEQLRQSGIVLGGSPYDYYSLETADDVAEMRQLLLRHRDSTGRAAGIVMNFVMGNLDFARMQGEGFDKIHLLPLSHGLPGRWERPGLFQAYRQGVEDRVFYPSLHGLTHFNAVAVENALARDEGRRQLLHTLWSAETPYIYCRMPWIGYEYLNPGRPNAGFLSLAAQSELIQQAAKIFSDFFSISARSACAPGYRANSDTRRAWARSGIRVAQTRGTRSMHPYLDESETLLLSRTIDVEPAFGEIAVADLVKRAEKCFSNGIPAIVSMHSINFHSSLRDFRRATLRVLDEFLFALERRHPDLLYVHDGDVHCLVTQGRFEDGAISHVNARRLREGTEAILGN